jgi:hypothetical protein
MRKVLALAALQARDIESGTREHHASAGQHSTDKHGPP